MNTLTLKASPLAPARRHALRCNSKNRNSIINFAGKKAPAAAPVVVEDDIPSYFQDSSTVDGSSAVGEGMGLDQSVAVSPARAPVEKQAPPATSFWSSVPPLVWIGVGVLLGNVVGTALEFVKGGPQKMQEMAMQQMMKQMMKQAGGAPGASPFGGPGGMGGFPPMPGMPGAPGASPFGGPGGMGGFPPMGGASGAAGSAAGSAAAASPIDTTASAASPVAEGKETAAAPRETVTPSEVKEGTQSSSTKKKSAFVDVDVKESTTSSGSTESKGFFDANPTTGVTSEATTASTPPPFTPPPPPPPGATDASFSSSMLDMLKDENMQKMLYPYLPEPMRNPQTFEWMLNDPTMRKQLEDMMQGQMGGAAGGAPNAVQDLMRDADMSPEKMQAQFNQMGVDPSEMVSKIMQDPELAQLMTKPSVLSAIAECSKDPMAIMKYSSDKEVMLVFEKMSQMFPQGAGGMSPGGGFPGMPQ